MPRTCPRRRIPLNDLTIWPHLHICPLDLSCWRDLYAHGAPLRIYYRPTGHPKARHWTIPILIRISDRITGRWFADSEPITPRKLPSVRAVHSADTHVCDPDNADCAAYLFYLNPENLRPAGPMRRRKTTSSEGSAPSTSDPAPSLEQPPEA